MSNLNEDQKLLTGQDLVNYVRRETGMSPNDTLAALEDIKEIIGDLCRQWYRKHGKKTS